MEALKQRILQDGTIIDNRYLENRQLSEPPNRYGLGSKNGGRICKTIEGCTYRPHCHH